MSELTELFDHYSKHRNKIKERLSEFKQIDRKDDKLIFRELCFCLLAANTSSRMAMRVMDRVGDVIFIGSEEEIRRKLNELRCRFYNRRAHFIYEARKVPIKFDREYLVENIKGFGYKESSHFLRNIGYEGYAILDKHVLNAMVDFGVIRSRPKNMNKNNYLLLEKNFVYGRRRLE